MGDVALELCKTAPPMFSAPVINDASVARAIAAAHQIAEDGDTLQAEEAMLLALRRLIGRHADGCHGTEPIESSGARRRFALYTDAIDADQADVPDLQQLASLADVTRFQVIRDFKRMTGLTPGAYVRNRRVRLAARLIEQGAPIVDAALAAGFADQSHLSRSFRGTHGITPGMYRRAYTHRTGGAA
jgi:AraC-like DNA-binding protein